jgi:hypothetical protein
LTVFDSPDATLACTRRNRSNTPLQALNLLNDAGYQLSGGALDRTGPVLQVAVGLGSQDYWA